MEAAHLGPKWNPRLNLNHKIATRTCRCVEESFKCLVVVIQRLLGCGKSAGL